MPRDWQDMTDDELLNFDGAQTALISRYERIIQHKQNDAMLAQASAIGDLEFALRSLQSHMSTDVVALIRTIESETKSLTTKLDEVSEKQKWTHRVGVVMTIVIAVATIAYTWATLDSVATQREANEIQRQALEIQRQVINQNDPSPDEQEPSEEQAQPKNK